MHCSRVFDSANQFLLFSAAVTVLFTSAVAAVVVVVVVVVHVLVVVFVLVFVLLLVLVLVLVLVVCHYHLLKDKKLLTVSFN